MTGPLALVGEIAQILDELAIPYALGGSMASSLVGEPRSTADVDVAVRLDAALGELQVVLPGSETSIWVTSPEDQVLRKLDWYRLAGSTSDRQWRDVLGILTVRGPALDTDYLRTFAAQVELSELLEQALGQSSDDG